MWILSGEICGYSGRSGDAGASSWGNSAVNWILMAVLGNRSVHLRQEGAGEAGTQARGALPPKARLTSPAPTLAAARVPGPVLTPSSGRPSTEARFPSPGPANGRLEHPRTPRTSSPTDVPAREA